QVSLTKELIPNIPETMSVDRAIDNYLNKARLYLSYIPELETEDLYSYINENLGNESVVHFDVNKNSDEVIANEYNRNYFNYLGYIILGCFITGVSTVMLSFHNKEIRKRQNASPMSTRNMNIQLILANMVFVLVYLSIFIVAGYITNPYRMINHNGILFIINSVIYTLTALSISYLIGITVVSKNAVSALSTVVSLGFAFLSGVFVPQELLGKAVQKVSSFTPTYWYVKANDSIATLNELNWDNGVGIFTDMAIELGFALVIFSIILVVNKGKRQQV
ncbi:MAG TPA: ABC transporter permease, partial [Clostridiales bacterium]|nr:ABC transporter permease [Clostridiales bacterium]